MNANRQGRREFLRRFVKLSGLAALGAVVAPHALGALTPAVKSTGALAPVSGMKIAGWRCPVCLYCNDPTALFCDVCDNNRSTILPPCDYPECGGGAKKPVDPAATGSR